MIKAIAIDDEPNALTVIKAHASKIAKIELVETFTNPIKALNYLDEKAIDLIFLDINMPDISGLEFSQSILKKDVLVIFTTAHSEYAIESYNLEVLDYLLKPIEFSRFHKAVAKAIERVEQSATFFFVNSGREQTKICYNDILFIQGEGNYVTYYLSNAKIMVRSTVKKTISRLPSSKFFQVHRSYVVAMKFVDKILDNQVHIGKHKIPIGANFKEAFMAEVSKFS